jgi:folate/biopterin transporter
MMQDDHDESDESDGSDGRGGHRAAARGPSDAPMAEQQRQQQQALVASSVDNEASHWIQTNLLQGVGGGPSTYAVMTVYFVQGVLGLASLARTFYMKDTLGLSPAESSALLGITSLPWVIKPVYGFLTDGLPVFGYKRKPYLLLAGTLGFVSWTSLATVVTTPWQVVLASTIASLGVAMSDVVVDSIVVERARDDPSASSGALQSLCWSCQAFGGLASAYFSGSLLESMSPQQVFSITSLFPLLVVAMAFQLDETRASPPPPGTSRGPLAEFGERSSKQAALLWDAVRERRVWLPALFLFLWQATPSSEGAFFYFITDELGIGPEFLGRIRVGTSLASLFGIWAYRKYLQDVPIKTVLGSLSVVSAVLGLSQLLLVTHYNRALGIPDTWFTFGDDLILTVLGQLAFMPLLVLAASLCPPGVEGTLFALLMSLFNGAGILGTELGALLTDALGVSASADGGPTDFTNLGLLVTICNLSSLLPLLAIDFLDEVPASPAAAPATSSASSGGVVQPLVDDDDDARDGS